MLSKDAGRSSSTAVSPRPNFIVSARADVPLLAGGTPGDAYLLGEDGRLEATLNGGVSWTVLRARTRSPLVGAAFPTAAIGYLTAADHVLRKTTNGGASWFSLPARVGSGTTLAAPRPGIVLLVGPHGIRRSSDGGRKFRDVRGHVKITAGGKGRAVASLKLGHILTVRGTVFAWNASSVYESTDTGSTWSAIPLPPRTPIAALSFVNPRIGYVVNYSAEVLVTRDRGATWATVPTGSTDISEISFASPRDGMIAQGPDNELGSDLLATTDGGRTWRPEIVDGGASNNTDDAYLGLSVLATPGHDYLVNPDSQYRDGDTAVFATTNGGASPKPSRLEISIGPRAVSASKLHQIRRNRVTITGKLSPVTSGSEQIQLSHRSSRSLNWSSRLVTVSSSATFRATVANIQSTTDFVVSATGDGVHGAAGAYAGLTVTH